MAPKHRDGDVVVAVSGKWVSWAHTVVAYTAFLGALVTGLYLHYHKIVQNEYYVSDHPTAPDYLTGSAGLSPGMVPISFRNHW